MALKRIPFAAWEPDRSALFGDHATEARGVIAGKGGYRPFAAPYDDPASVALPAAVAGAFSFRDGTGAPQTVAGTVSALYALDGGAWVSKGTGYTASEWSICAFGDDFYAADIGTDLQRAAASGGAVGAFSAVSGAPRAKRAGVIKDFLFLGNLSTGNRTVRWSAINDAASWPALGSSAAQAVQSDAQTFPTGGDVTAIKGGLAGVDGLIFQEGAVWRATYVGSPFVFQFDALDRERGALAPNGVAIAGGAAYYLAWDGFYATDGSQTRPIGAERVDLWFRSEVDLSRIREVRAVADPSRRVVIWTFPSTVCPLGKHDSALVYDYAFDAWSRAEFDSSWAFDYYLPGVTLEGLGAAYPDGLDSIPFSLDDKSLSGGDFSAAIFGADHRIQRLSGLPMEAVIETSEIGGDGRMLIQAMRPYVDGASATVALGHRESQSAPPVFDPPVSVGGFDGFGYMHRSTRYARARVTVPSGQPWKQAQAVDVMFEPEGWK